ncbi:MAG TPA: hypothetical protein VG860_18500 [Terriglobia bacterium]|jgi:hypothetical protein|nr:hypothetical protein [Terriglobia bacterium]
MSPEYEAILDRLDKLERRDRRSRAERLVMLAVIGWLLATGPAARLLVTAAPQLEAGARGARVVTGQSLAGLRRLMRVQPALDPRTVIEDEREAFGAPAPNLAKPVAAPVVAASSARPRASKAGTTAKLRPQVPALPAARKPAMAQSVAVPRRSLAQARSAGQARFPGQVSLAAQASLAPSGRRSIRRLPAASAASLAAAGLLIGRDLEKRLPQLPGDESLRTLALAEWPDPGAVGLPHRAGLREPPAGAARLLPDALNPDAASPPSMPPAAAAPEPPPTVPAAPVVLKALGYAQAGDGSAQIVLSDGNALFVVNEGEEFLDRFRVVSVGPEGVDVKDRLTNETIHLSFGP